MTGLPSPPMKMRGERATSKLPTATVRTLPPRPDDLPISGAQKTKPIGRMAPVLATGFTPGQGRGPIDNRPQVLQPVAMGLRPTNCNENAPRDAAGFATYSSLAIPLFSRSCGTFSMVPHQCDYE